MYLTPHAKSPRDDLTAAGYAFVGGFFALRFAGPCAALCAGGALTSLRITWSNGMRSSSYEDASVFLVALAGDALVADLDVMKVPTPI
jgi:hypothetical protein